MEIPKLSGDGAVEVLVERGEVGGCALQRTRDLGEPSIEFESGGGVEEFAGGDPVGVVGGPFEGGGDVGAVVSEAEADVDRTPSFSSFGHRERVEVFKVSVADFFGNA